MLRKAVNSTVEHIAEIKVMKISCKCMHCTRTVHKCVDFTEFFHKIRFVFKTYTEFTKKLHSY